MKLLRLYLRQDLPVLCEMLEKLVHCFVCLSAVNACGEYLIDVLRVTFAWQINTVTGTCEALVYFLESAAMMPSTTRRRMQRALTNCVPVSLLSYMALYRTVLNFHLYRPRGCPD